jgi:folate-binding protein YgfZ
MQVWTEFLAQQKPQALDTQNALCALEQTALLYVGGDDASDFLQNQLSNDITKIDEARSQLSSMSNAKGRMLAIFQVIRIDGGYILIMPRDIIADIAQKLQKFILMSKVVLADITDSFARIGVTTDKAEIISAQDFPDEINAVYQSDSLISLQLPAATGRQRYLLLSNDENEAVSLWQKLAQKLAINAETNWRLQQIDAGVPTLYAATSGAFVLQMSNLQLLDGVSFKKGCYPGQEVVARMQYLGKLKRRMYRAQILSSQCPQAGDELCSRGADAPDSSGKVVDAVTLDDDHCALLFIAQIAKADAGELVLCDQPQVELEILPLPYSIDPE